MVARAAGCTFTTITAAALAPAFNVPASQVTTPPVWLQDGPADANVTETGSTSEMVTPWACEGPVLVTVSVYRSVPPAIAGSGDASLVRVSTVSAPTFVLSRRLLLALLLSAWSPCTKAVFAIGPRMAGSTD